MSASTKKTSSQQTRREVLDPTAKRGLDTILNRATALQDTALVPDLGAGTLDAISGLTTDLGGGSERGREFLDERLGAEFGAGGREALDRASGFAADAAARSVGDAFTAGGRTGSPASAKAIAQGVATAVAPFQFGFEQNELARKDRFDAQQTATAFGLDKIETAEDATELQRRLANLEAQGLIDANTKAKFEEPFRRLGLLAGITVGAAAQAPKTTTGTGEQKTTEFGVNLI